MADAVVIIAIAAFLVGVVVGIFLAAAFGVRRDDRYLNLTGEAPSLLTRSVRRLDGLRRRDLDAEFFRPDGGLRH